MFEFGSLGFPSVNISLFANVIFKYVTVFSTNKSSLALSAIPKSNLSNMWLTPSIFPSTVTFDFPLVSNSTSVLNGFCCQKSDQFNKCNMYFISNYLSCQ